MVNALRSFLSRISWLGLLSIYGEKLVEAGFEYVCSNNETMLLFRKRK